MDAFKAKFGGEPNAPPEKPKAKKGQKAAAPAVPNTPEIVALLEELKIKSPDEINVMITEQGDAVRQLKTAKADKGSIDSAVGRLLALKSALAGKAPQ